MTYTNISVVIPLYNKELELPRTIESIVAQTVRPLEVIVVNDGSTDNSLQIAYDLQRKYVSELNVVVLDQPNGGVSNARNTGISAAAGDVIAFIDADDEWEAHFIAEIQALAIRFPQASCYTTNYQKFDHGHYINPKIRFGRDVSDCTLMPDFFAIAARGDLPFVMSSFAIQTKVIRQLGGFVEGEPMGEDQDVFAKVALTQLIAYSPKVLLFYYLDANNRACRLNHPKEECGFSIRLKQQVQTGDCPQAVRQAVLAYTATHLIHLARDNVKGGQYQAAKQLLADHRCRFLRLKRISCYVRLYIHLLKDQFLSKRHA